MAEQEPRQMIEMPDFSDPAVQAQYGPTTFGPDGWYVTEPLPRYWQSSKQTEQADGDIKFAVLENLRSEISFARFDEKLIHNAYGVARHMADVVLFAAGSREGEQADGGANNVAGILDGIRYLAHPRVFRSEDTGRVLGSVGNQQLSINMEQINKSAGESLKDRLLAKGVELRSPSDAYLISTMHVAGHEVGHLMLGGFSEKDNRYAGVGQLKASKVFLAQHPELAFTGDWETDAWIHEERFAEGIGLLVTEEVVQTLGYTDEEVQAILDELDFSAGLDAVDGMHQLDHITEHPIPGPISQIMEDRGLTEEDDVNSQLYQGYLGYLAPLSTADIIKQIRETSSLLFVNGNEDRGLLEKLDEITRGNKWGRYASEHQSDETKSLLKKLIDKRKKVLEAKAPGDSPKAGFIARKVGALARKRAA